MALSDTANGASAFANALDVAKDEGIEGLIRQISQDIYASRFCARAVVFSNSGANNGVLTLRSQGSANVFNTRPMDLVGSRWLMPNQRVQFYDPAAGTLRTDAGGREGRRETLSLAMPPAAKPLDDDLVDAGPAQLPLLRLLFCTWRGSFTLIVFLGLMQNYALRVVMSVAIGAARRAARAAVACCAGPVTRPPPPRPARSQCRCPRSSATTTARSRGSWRPFSRVTCSRSLSRGMLRPGLAATASCCLAS
jgi:hypothetical protein